MHRTITVAALALALALPPLAGAAVAAEQTVALTLKDHKFTPAGPTIPAGTRVRFTVKNLDATTAEFISDDFKGGKVIPGGQEATFFIGPLQPGTYEFHDEYAEDVSKARLIVK